MWFHYINQLVAIKYNKSKEYKFNTIKLKFSLGFTMKKTTPFWNGIVEDYIYNVLHILRLLRLMFSEFWSKQCKLYHNLIF